MRHILFLFVISVLLRHGETASDLVATLGSGCIVTIKGNKPEIIIEDTDFRVAEGTKTFYSVVFKTLAEHDGVTDLPVPGRSFNLESGFTASDIDQKPITVFDDRGVARTYLGLQFSKLNPSMADPTFPDTLLIELDILLNQDKGVNVKYTNTEKPRFPFESIKTRLRVQRWFNEDSTVDPVRRKNYLRLTTTVTPQETATGPARPVYYRAFENPIFAFERDQDSIQDVFDDVAITNKKAILNTVDEIPLTSTYGLFNNRVQFTPSSTEISASSGESSYRDSFEIRFSQTVNLDDFAGPAVKIVTVPMMYRDFKSTYLTPASSFTFMVDIPYFLREAVYDPTMGAPSVMTESILWSVNGVLIFSAISLVILFILSTQSTAAFERAENEYLSTEKFLKEKGGGGEEAGGDDE